MQVILRQKLHQFRKGFITGSSNQISNLKKLKMSSLLKWYAKITAFLGTKISILNLNCLFKSVKIPVLSTYLGTEILAVKNFRNSKLPKDFNVDQFQRLKMWILTKFDLQNYPNIDFDPFLWLTFWILIGLDMSKSGVGNVEDDVI